MSVQERDYMRIEETGEGVIAASEGEASELLRFACPTQAADGKWYRTTIAVSNVPVIDLYNILSNAAFIALDLRRIADQPDLKNSTIRPAIESAARRIESLRNMLRDRDGRHRGTTEGHIHPGKETDEQSTQRPSQDGGPAEKAG